MTVFPAA